MGSLKKAILRGVGTGIKETLAQEREDKRLAVEDAFKERELTIREQESKLRQQSLQLEQMQTKTKINHAQLVRTAMSSGYTDQNAGYGSDAMAKAMTQYVGDGRAYKHEGYNAKGLPVWAVGTYKTDETTGKPIADPATGKPQFEPLPGPDGKPQTMTWKDPNDWVSFVNSNMSPDYLFGLQAQERTFEMTRRENAAKLKELQEEKKMLAGTEQGKVELAKDKQATSTDKAREDLYRAQAREADAESKRKAAGGMSDAEMKAMGQLADDLRQAYSGYAIDPQTAKQMAAMTSNPKVRERVAASLKEALNADNQAEAMEQFIQAGTSQGIPRPFMQKLADDAIQGHETQQEAGIGSDSWIKNLLSNFGNYFKSDK